MNPSDNYNTRIYTRKAESVKDGIPVFSRNDAYIENYKKIASDHVSQMSKTQENPFMEEEMWTSLEASTREYIRKHVAKGSRILDVGVGLGRLLEPLSEYERYGMDLSVDYLAIAKRCGIEVALAKIEDMPYHAHFFDAIVVCDVLEHVIDLNYCSEKILSCLRPGGVLIVRVPFKEDLEVYLREDLSYEFIHLRNFDEASLRLYFQKIFRLQFIEAATTTPYLQGTPRLKLRLLPEKSRAKLLQMSVGRPELMPIAEALKISEEDFQAWIYDLKDRSKALFNDIVEDLILGIDINAVFVKPYKELASYQNLRKTTIEAPLIHQASEDTAFTELGNDFAKFRHSVNEQFRDVNIESKKLMERLEVTSAQQKQSIELLMQLKSSIDDTLSTLSAPLYKKLSGIIRRFSKLFH